MFLTFIAMRYNPVIPAKTEIYREKVQMVVVSK